jgi:hypothetical protein
MSRYAACFVEEYRTLSLVEDIAEYLAGFDRQLEVVRASLATAGLEPEAEPERSDPRWCCGRGCHPCIITVYLEAAEVWMVRQQRRIEAAQT